MTKIIKIERVPLRFSLYSERVFGKNDTPCFWPTHIITTEGGHRFQLDDVKCDIRDAETGSFIQWWDGETIFDIKIEVPYRTQDAEEWCGEKRQGNRMKYNGSIVPISKRPKDELMKVLSLK